jgi:hypothetical protein
VNFRRIVNALAAGLAVSLGTGVGEAQAQYNNGQAAYQQQQQQQQYQQQQYQQQQRLEQMRRMAEEQYQRGQQLALQQRQQDEAYRREQQRIYDQQQNTQRENTRRTEEMWRHQQPQPGSAPQGRVQPVGTVFSADTPVGQAKTEKQGVISAPAALGAVELTDAMPKAVPGTEEPKNAVPNAETRTNTGSGFGSMVLVAVAALAFLGLSGVFVYFRVPGLRGSSTSK